MKKIYSIKQGVRFDNQTAVSLELDIRNFERELKKTTKKEVKKFRKKHYYNFNSGITMGRRSKKFKKFKNKHLNSFSSLYKSFNSLPDTSNNSNE